MNKKLIITIISFLLGIVFFVFGLNYFIKFMPMPELPDGMLKDYFNIMYKSNYLLVVKILEVVIGALFFIPKTRALAAILIFPIVINILLFELLIAGVPGIAVVLTILNIALFVLNKDKYKSIIS